MKIMNSLLKMLDESFKYIAQGFETYPLPIILFIISLISFALYIYAFYSQYFFTTQGTTNATEDMVQKLVSRATKHSAKSIKHQHKAIIVAYKESVTALALLNCAMVLIEE